MLFEKQFYTLGMKNNSGRILTLLSSLEIKNRYLQNIEDANIKEAIDYIMVNKKLKENRENSIVFLKQALNG